MTDALRDAWLAEMWTPCPEVPRDVRAGWAAVAAAQCAELDERARDCGQPVHGKAA